MMNNRELMGEEKPVGVSMLVWNILMLVSLAIVFFAAYTSMSHKLTNPATGGMVLGGVVTFALLMFFGFSATPSRRADEQ